MKKIKYLLIVLVTLMLTSNISATSTQITCTSNLYAWNNNEYQIIQKGYDFKKSENKEFLLQFTINKDNTSINARIDLTGMKGLEIQEDSIKINGVSTSLKQLTNITLTSSTTVEMKVNYIHNSSEVASKIKLYLIDQEETHSFTFSYTMRGQMTSDSIYTVKFYGIANELIDTQQVEENSSAILPEVTYIGYKTTGYNTKKDGSGTYYTNEPIHTDQTFYLIYEPLQFNVTYHIDNEVYNRLKVYFGDEIKQIEAPYKQGYTFVVWLGASGIISEDVDLYAVYQNIDTKEYITTGSLTYTSSELEVIVNKLKEENGGNQQNRYRNLDNNSEFYAYVDQNGSLAFISIDNTNTTQSNNVWVLVVLLGITGMVFSIYKQRIHKNSRRV